MNAIAAKDWLEFRRDRRLWIAAIALICLALAAALAARAQVTAHAADRAAANAQERATWEGQGERNPHSAAHFATWAFRPLTPLAVLDPGVTPYAGSAIWMEAHARNAPVARPMADSAAGNFGVGFSLAAILQVIFPLLIFAIAAGSVAAERERGTLRLMLAQGEAPGRMLWGKVVGLGWISAALFVPVVGAGLLMALVAGPADPQRLLLWATAYAVWFAILALLAVAVSTRAQTAAQALLVLVGLWLILVLIVPRIGTALAERIVPTPTVQAFWAGVDADKEKLPKIFEEDAEAFGRQMAARYGVERVEDLPVNLQGLTLDAAERQEAAVHNRHYARLHAVYARQQDVLRWAGLASPLVALQTVSQALAGTDMAHQLAFQDQAEAQRFATVAVLNRDMIENAGTADYDYKAGADLWARTGAFVYTPPPLGAVLTSIRVEAAILLGWLLAAMLLLRASARSLSRALLG